MGGTPRFASNTYASTSQGKAQIPNIEVEEEDVQLIKICYGEDENIGALLSGQVCEDFKHYVPNDENVAPQQLCEVAQSPN